MSNRIEDKIRDYLADHLEILEKGLNLVGKEYELPSPFGAGGRIDIVARDVFEHVVIIEIKRSDQTSRQALNEIHKYTALFRIRQGLDESSVRVLIISTEWHELLLPLSEFVDTTPYAVEGVLITALPNGVVTKASKVNLVAKVGALEVSRAQAIYLFHEGNTRDMQEPQLVAAVKAAGVNDFAIFHCDYTRKSPSVIYPHALYLCFSSPLRYLSNSEQDELKARIGWDENIDNPDENFLDAINKAMSGKWDSFEIGYPEKLTNIRHKWSVSVSLRSGRLDAKQSVLTDEEVIGLTQTIRGGSHYYLRKISSPRFAIAWRNLRQEIGPVLRGSRKWEESVPAYLDEIEANIPRATVSVTAYNPANLFLSLYHMARDEDLSKCPYLEIVVEDSASSVVRVMQGFLSWTGRSIRTSPDVLMKRIYQDLDHWMIAVHFGETFEYEEKAVKTHQLEIIILEWYFIGDREHGPSEIIVQNGGIVRQPFDERQHRPLVKFSSSQQKYLRSLKLYMEHQIGGLSRDT